MFEDGRVINRSSAIAATENPASPGADDNDGFFRHDGLEFCLARESQTRPRFACSSNLLLNDFANASDITLTATNFHRRTFGKSPR